MEGNANNWSILMLLPLVWSLRRVVATIVDTFNKEYDTFPYFSTELLTKNPVLLQLCINVTKSF